MSALNELISEYGLFVPIPNDPLNDDELRRMSAMQGAARAELAAIRADVEQLTRDLREVTAHRDEMARMAKSALNERDALRAEVERLTKDVDRWESTSYAQALEEHKLRADNERLRAEQRERYAQACMHLGWPSGPVYPEGGLNRAVHQLAQVAEEARAREETARAEVERLRGLLRGYGKHKSWCQSEQRPEVNLPCNCGLTAALEAKP